MIKIDTFLEGLGVVVLSLLIIVVSALLTGWVVMLLWNWLVPMLFGLRVITYIEGWGIACLSGILFKGTTTVNNK